MSTTGYLYNAQAEITSESSFVCLYLTARKVPGRGRGRASHVQGHGRQLGGTDGRRPGLGAPRQPWVSRGGRTWTPQPPRPLSALPGSHSEIPAGGMGELGAHSGSAEAA